MRVFGKKLASWSGRSCELVVVGEGRMERKQKELLYIVRTW
jgi:hypothetical protein